MKNITEKYLNISSKDWIYIIFSLKMFMKLKLQVLDVDYFLNTNKPVVRIFGRTESSRAVCVCVDDFEPYFYVKASYMEVARFYADNPEIKKIEEVGVSSKTYQDVENYMHITAECSATA